MSRSYPKLSPAEFELMKTLWDLERATVAEVRDAHKARQRSELAYTTVMTMLGRLVDKEALRVDKDKQPFCYRPAIRRSTLLRDRLRDFVELSFDGDAEELVRLLVSDGLIEADRLGELHVSDEETS